jgi:hypothetical protein
MALADTYIVSDSTPDPRKPTHCAWYIDAEPKEILPVALDAAGLPYCSRDMSLTASGAHSLKAAFVIKDATWGDREGAQSAPFGFTVPSSPSTVPAALKVIVK